MLYEHGLGPRTVRQSATTLPEHRPPRHQALAWPPDRLIGKWGQSTQLPFASPGQKVIE